ncbi:hypothetical protein GYMLUDRAFT_39742 [Collybiopsis luxurians FD-317 M1]|nr:hypothetical protein GYMLUDRAFT_39742 [Collybiopsis luxurians FD-317 M1]
MSFSMSHRILLPYPITNVFRTLSSFTEMERLQKLTPEAQNFVILKTDHVQLPHDALSLIRGGDSLPANCPRPRDLPSSASGPGSISDEANSTLENLEPDTPPGSDPSPTLRTRTFPRAQFEFSGTVPILFGLIHKPLSVSGAQIIDEEAKVVLFESGVTASGIKEVKLRIFREVKIPLGYSQEEDEGDKMGTEVCEYVWGTCPFGLSLLLKFLAPKVHREHMELYHHLFE